ncbi:hypothetical protein ACVXG9_18305 [Escherichia coli]
MLMFGNGERPWWRWRTVWRWVSRLVKSAMCVYRDVIVKRRCLAGSGVDIHPLDSPWKIDPIPSVWLRFVRARITNRWHRSRKPKPCAAAAAETVGKTYVLLPSSRKVRR